MIISRLAVTDFQVFQGRHEFDLAPRTKYNSKRPIILFGGLNGAGKTTTLTAVRLALYGRQILGRSTSSKAYESYLKESIHKARDSIVQANSASLELDFTYAKLGELKRYRVTRRWIAKGNKLTEKLSITENDKVLSELTNDQCQGFLNELVPVGVSELFFFDGEKIKELAEDQNGQALGDAIKKLLGLDVLDTLNADLGIILRSYTKERSSEERRKKTQELEDKLQQIENEAIQEHSYIYQVKIRIEELQTNIRRLEGKLSEKGGAWATSREKEIEKQAALSSERKSIIAQLQEIMAGAFPVGLAKQVGADTLEQLEAELSYKRRLHTSSLVKERLDSLKKKLKSSLKKSELGPVNEILDSEFEALLDVEQSVRSIHDKSESEVQRIRSLIEESSTEAVAKAVELKARLDTVEDEIDKAGKNIDRAPLESQIKPIVDEINCLQKQLTDAITIKTQHVESYKRLLRESMELIRELDKLSAKALEEVGSDRASVYARSSKEVLKKFSKAMAKRKVADLEEEFLRSFHQLARKDDIKLSAKIDPDTFSVELFDDAGHSLDKNRLSAGEKQIYAISILEALARTSGRKLPIIIDTPLGRLDSKHRNKLVNNYFPRASHQVIILSTDTEVDEQFYRELSPQISHAFKLNYDPQTGSTVPTEEYFWKPLLQETA